MPVFSHFNHSNFEIFIKQIPFFRKSVNLQGKRLFSDEYHIFQAKLEYTSVANPGNDG